MRKMLTVAIAALMASASFGPRLHARTAGTCPPDPTLCATIHDQGTLYVCTDDAFVWFCGPSGWNTFATITPSGVLAANPQCWPSPCITKGQVSVTSDATDPNDATVTALSLVDLTTGKPTANFQAPRYNLATGKVDWQTDPVPFIPTILQATATVDLDFSGGSDGGTCTAETTVSASGAADGDACVAGVPTAAKVAGVNVYCRGSDADQAAVWACCVTAVDCADPPSADYPLRILK